MLAEFEGGILMARKSSGKSDAQSSARKTTKKTTKKKAPAAEPEPVEVIDRRTAVTGGQPAAEETPQSAVVEEAPPAEPAAEEPQPPFGEEKKPKEEPGLDEETLRALIPDDVYQVLRTNLQVLAGLAWAKLGLIPSPKTGQIAKDLAQAKTAIDMVDQIITALEPAADGTEIREYRNLLHTLRLNYVQQQSG